MRRWTLVMPTSQISPYLSPEPMLQEPNWVMTQAQEGFSPPTYAYARNNPLRYTDPDGKVPVLVPFSPNCAKVCSEAAREAAAKKPGSSCVPISYSGVYDVVRGGQFSSNVFLGCLCSGFRKSSWDVDFWVSFRPASSVPSRIK
jgi:hypothetical protein